MVRSPPLPHRIVEEYQISVKSCVQSRGCGTSVANVPSSIVDRETLGAGNVGIVLPLGLRITTDCTAVRGHPFHSDLNMRK